MEIMWRRGEAASKRDVCQSLDRPRSFNTVMTVTKGLLLRSGRRLSYRYRVAVDSQALHVRLTDFGDLATAGFVEATDVMDEERLAQLLEHLRAKAGETGRKGDA